MNTITIELCKEDRKRIDELIAFAGLIAGELKSKPSTETHPIDASTTHLEPVEETLATPALDPAPEVTPVSLAEFQKAVTIVCAKGPAQKKAAKEIINKYATSVSAVPEDKRAEAMAELAQI